ncbi:MAG: hypothetical protein IKC82_07840 [Lentisphaeria bacterium]|nr:hypothetical protein [Lentisphaeria bacterium]
MKKSFFAAIDLGATSGRIMLDKGDGKVNEIYRFPTPMVRNDAGIFWDFEALFAGIISGLKLLENVSGNIASISCDSWAQDFGMLDENGSPVAMPFSYRDGKCKVSSAARLEYIAEFFPEYLKKTVQILHIADLIHFYLCKSARSNYSLAAISGLDITHKLLAPIADCEIIGTVNHPALSFLHGVPVISGAGHDTAAAFVCGDPQDNEIMTSVGTWQMTAERWDDTAEIPEDFRRLPLPHRKCARTRGGMGLWVFQQCVKLWKERGIFPGYAVLDAEAQKCTLPGFIDPDTPELFSPENMEEAICSLVKKTLTPPEMTALLLRGTAHRIAMTVKSFDKEFSRVIAVGGGINGEFFCGLLKKELHPVMLTVGSSEASAAGNIAIQKQVINNI